ncbi:gluconate 2-dehydrogenase subunit 3 family protein [Paraglaciecola aquimarina]|uniref:Gluconate 2-dehydrogenase subunit 3 family protein n=1 Tax=Paraglaciecola algarum TaxID=3050085 RepID=A0ABS9D7E7_9ALTE|nr:gluconate 2-dehydrogenase subunit 3 family protein [Paraglaciecola sp. G1-23]MCF2948871.1 gluconate 2-dehydrogenase subunit 3 family protein [Paraglaciecola sp. G1-23]
MQSHTITRRVFIGASTFILSVPLLASSFNKQRSLIEITQDGQFFSSSELTVLSDVADIMLPKTDTPSATDAHVVVILDAMMLSWAVTHTQEQFRACIKLIEDLATQTYDSVYINLSLAKRSQLITELDSRAFEQKKSNMSVNYRRLKEMIFHIYYTSEQVATDYVAMPGGYAGDISKTEFEAAQKRGYL